MRGNISLEQGGYLVAVLGLVIAAVGGIFDVQWALITGIIMIVGGGLISKGLPQ